MVPFPAALQRDSLELGPIEGREAGHDYDADLDFGGLAVGISRHDPHTEELQAVHLGLDPTLDMVARPLLPESPAELRAGSRFVQLRRDILLAMRDCFGGWV